MLARSILVTFAVAVLAGAAPPGPAKISFERGEQALAENRLDEAAAAYRAAIAARPGYAEAINGLGSVLFKQGKKEEAIAQFKAAIEADPNFKLAHFNLGYAARKSEDFGTAARAYEKYTQLDPNDPDGYYGLGESYRQLGQSSKAVAAYEQFVAKETRPSEQKWVDKAKEYIAALKKESPPVSKTEVIAAAAAPPSSASPSSAQPTIAAVGSAAVTRQIAEGDRLMEEKKYRDASFSYLDAVNADPNNVEALFKLGNSYAVLGYYVQAIERWNKVLQLTSDAAVRKSAQDNISRAQAKVGQLSMTAQPNQSPPPGPPALDPTRSQARTAYEQGVRQIGARDYGGAMQSLTQAIQLEPTLAVAYVARGSANIGLRRYSEAAADYESALRLDGSMASPLYGLGEALRAMGRSTDAKQYYERYASSAAADVRPELQREARQKADKLR